MIDQEWQCFIKPFHSDLKKKANGLPVQMVPVILYSDDTVDPRLSEPQLSEPSIIRIQKQIKILGSKFKEILLHHHL